MHANRRTKFGSILIASAVSLALSDVVNAEDDVLRVPEMVVTSRAREEALRDVPISLSLVSGDTIDATGIQNLEDLADSVPNFSVTQDPIGDKINIRGIQTSEVASLEQSVSTFVDGVNRGRGTQARLRFLDLERVEVLRGPQGTLFGKNTVGGALNLTTRKPTSEFAASFNAGFDPELEESSIGGFVSGPLAETVRGRLAYAGTDQNEGYIDNRFYGNSAPTARNNSVRGILELDATDSMLLRLRAEYQDFDLDGQPFALRTVGPLAPVLSPFGITGGSSTQTAIGQMRSGPLDFGSNGKMEGDAQEFALTLKQELASGTSLEVIGALSTLDFKRRLDGDFSPLEFVGFDDTEDSEQASLSLRVLSPDKGRMRYVAGLYYQHTDLELTGLGSFNPLGIQGLLGSLCQSAGLSAADSVQLFSSLAGINGLTAADSASQLARAGNAAAVENCAASGAVLAVPVPVARVNSLDQEGDATAVYGQVDFDLTQKLQLTVGLRYTVEDKQARQQVFSSNFGTRQPNPALDPVLGLFFESMPHDFSRDQLDRSESKLTYAASLTWALSEGTNAYLSSSSGFKAGGFSSVAFSGTPAQAEFAPEEVTSYEIGFKSTFLNNRAQFNAAYFFNEIEDLQVAQFNGDATFIVQNAAEAEVQGLELDGRLQVTRNLALSLAASYTDFEFTSFRSAACTTQQVQALRQSTYAQGTALLNDGDPTNDAAGFMAQLFGSVQTLQGCSAMGINDLRGRTAEQVPEFTAQLGLDYHLELGASGFVIDALADVTWNDRQFRQTDLDPLSESGSFAKTNLSLSFYRTGRPWTVMLVGRNIFDKQTFSYVNDTPLLENARQQIVDRPRTVKLQLRYDF